MCRWCAGAYWIHHLHGQVVGLWNPNDFLGNLSSPLRFMIKRYPGLARLVAHLTLTSAELVRAYRIALLALTVSGRIAVRRGMTEAKVPRIMLGFRKLQVVDSCDKPSDLLRLICDG